ncbi:MAG: winged helix DNA-binding domain-containing protein [Actinomycetota bacterium]
MTNDAIARRRMHNQHLWGAPLAGFEEVVRRLGAMQAQEFPYAKWSVAQRAGGVDEAAIDRAFADGAILRTHVLRPTWHFVLPADIRWLLALSAPRVHASNRLYYRRFELDEELLAKCNALLAKALEGGTQLTRKQLADVLDRAGISASGPRLAYIVMHAELDAVICSGAPRGKQHTYALLDERAPQARALDRDEALAELTRRYFTARGPATMRDYSWWSSLTAADCRSGLDMIKSRLEQEVVDGRTYWFAAHPAPGKKASQAIDLVQCYDECIVSYSESKDVLRAPPAMGAPSADTAAFYHAVLLDGRVIGHWRRAPKQKHPVVETSFYRPLARAEARALDAAVERFGRFLGMPVTLNGN